MADEIETARHVILARIAEDLARLKADIEHWKAGISEIAGRDVRPREDPEQRRRDRAAMLRSRPGAGSTFRELLRESESDVDFILELDPH